MIGNIGNFKPLNILKSHIEKSVASNSYAAKSLLFTTVGLDVYSNVVDYFQLSKSKKIKKDDKEYLKMFKLTNALVSSTSETAVGLIIISDKFQKLIIKGISKFEKDFAKILNKGVGENIMKISSLLGAVLFTKRIIVPLIVTPLASMFKKKINSLDENKDKALKSSYENHFEQAENIFKPSINFKKSEENIFKKYKRMKSRQDLNV